jgi:predicted NAD/FAD-binding protein
VGVDTGFIVFNERNYPLFTRLLERIGVASRPTEMSFSVRCDANGLEYCSTDLDRVFVQRRNLLSPAFHRMLLDILRFNREPRAAMT